jgi:dipeptidyl aminopeptidase/acylaminoacyl peptidase
MRSAAMKKIFVTALFCVLAAIAAHAADGPYTLEQIMSAPFPSDLTAARQGSRIAWVVDVEGRRNLWVADGPKLVARQLTNYKLDDGQEITDVSFSADGMNILFIRGGNKNAAGEVPNPLSDPAGVDQALYVVPRAGGAPRKIDVAREPEVSPRGNWVAYLKETQLWVAPIVGAGKPVQVIARGTNGSPVWAPDSKRFAFVSNRGMHSLIGIYDLAKKSVGYVSPSVDRDLSPQWSADGRSVAFLRFPARTIPASGGGGGFGPAGRGTEWSVLIADVTQTDVNTFGVGHTHEVWNSASFGAGINGVIGAERPSSLLNWMADDRFVFLSEKDGWQHLYSLPAEDGTPTLLTPGECEVEFFSIAPDRKSVLYNSNCGDIDRRHLWRVSVSGGDPVQLTSGETIEWGVVATGDGKWLAYVGSDARNPGMVQLIAAVPKGEAKLTLAMQTLHKDFPADKLVVPQQVIFDAADGLHIHGQLFLPAGGDDSRKPAIIFTHGGPPRQMLLGWHYMYYYRNSYAMNQYLASRGYVVLSVNYRRGIGYGRDFRMAPNSGAEGAAEYQDVVAGAKYLAGRADVDAARIGLWGGSYGGYLTAMGLARNSDLFAAGVDLHGVHDWSQRLIGGGAPGVPAPTPDPARVKLARDSSPVASISTWRSPVLLIQGDDDRNVNFTQMVDLVPRLRQQKVEFKQLVFPDEVHDFLLHRHWMEAYRAGANFFDAHLKSDSRANAATGNK